MLIQTQWKCSECNEAFNTRGELRLHAKIHDAIKDMTINGHAPERDEALDMLGDGMPTPALRFVIRKFTMPGMVEGEYREARILQQLWQFGDEMRPETKWIDVPSFEEGV